jgi:hypothetical protein
MAKGPTDTNKFIINNQYFQGGSTIDYKMGIANSFYYSNNLDTRTFPSQMSVLPASRQLSGNLNDLILAMDQDLDGVRYGVGSKGTLYTIDTSNNVTYSGTIPENGSAGLLYSQISDNLYIPGQTAVSLYGQCTSGNPGNPTLSTNLYAQSASVALGCTALFNTTTGNFDGQVGYRNNITADGLGVNSGITGNNYKSLVTNSLANSYTLNSNIIENNTNFCYFAPDIEPFYSVAVYVDNKGTGNWTLTMHDSLNNNLGAVTITNANMVANGWNEFVFNKQVRAHINASNVGYAPTYHFHLTSSVSGDTASVYTYNANDLSGCNFLLFAYRLVETNNGWHPTAFFTGAGTALLCIGNGEYLSTYNFGNDSNPSNTQWQRSNLVFKPGDEVCGLTVNNQYLVIATERRSSDTSRNSQTGTLYFWDGSTNAPNFKIDIPMGSPYGLYTLDNITYFACAGALFAWSQGQTVLKVRKLAYQQTDYMDAVDETRVLPTAFTSRYSVLMMGYPSSTTDTNVDFGIWSWGNVDLTYPNSLILSYTQSPGILNYSSVNIYQLGCVENFVDSMYSAWQYTDTSGHIHYGLDVIDNFSNPAPTFTWQSLIFDGGVAYKEKMAVRYKVYFEPLPTGCTLTPWYIIDRGGLEGVLQPVNIATAKVFGTTVGAGATETFIEMNNARFHEIQYGFDGTCNDTATVPPVILCVALEVDPLENEVDIEPGET